MSERELGEVKTLLLLRLQVETDGVSKLRLRPHLQLLNENPAHLQGQRSLRLPSMKHVIRPYGLGSGDLLRDPTVPLQGWSVQWAQVHLLYFGIVRFCPPLKTFSRLGLRHCRLIYLCNVVVWIVGWTNL